METLRTRPLPLRLQHLSDLLLPCHRLLRCALLVLLLVLKSPSNLREWPLSRQQPLLVLNVMRTRLKLLWSWTAVFDCSDADINRFLDDLQDYLGSATVSFVSIRDNMLRVLICDSTSLPELETALRQRDSAQVEFQNFDSLVRFVYGVPCGGDYSVSYIFDSPSAASMVTLPFTLMMVL